MATQLRLERDDLFGQTSPLALQNTHFGLQHADRLRIVGARLVVLALQHVRFLFVGDPLHLPFERELALQFVIRRIGLAQEIQAERRELIALLLGLDRLRRRGRRERRGPLKGRLLDLLLIGFFGRLHVGRDLRLLLNDRRLFVDERLDGGNDFGRLKSSRKMRVCRVDAFQRAKKRRTIGVNKPRFLHR